MPGYAKIRDPAPEEYYFLSGTRRAGPDIAQLDGAGVAEAVVDAHGRRFCYAGVAPRRGNGRLDTTALRPGEFLVEPGIIYRWDGTLVAQHTDPSAKAVFWRNLKASLFGR